MRVLELEINNVRGIVHVQLKPNGSNFVVWGPNGSGKSAVVDAIDFLLTGRVSRLTGRGTGGITLSRHGPHIDHGPEEATGRAIIQLPGLKEPVEIKRCMAKPTTLECDDSIRPHLDPIMTLARRGQHVLTRRDILRYITAEASTRAQEIQELLNISEVEDIRKAMVKVKNDLDGECGAAESSLDTAKGMVTATIQATTFDKDIVLQVVNQNRAVLGGQPIGILSSQLLKTELTPPILVSSDQAVNVTLLERDIQNLCDVTLEQNQAEIAKSDKELRDSIATIRSDPELSRALSRLQLTELGLKLIDDTGSCPLCDTAWPPGELRKYLEQRLSIAEVARQHQKSIKEASTTIVRHLNRTIASLQKVIPATEPIGLKTELSLLRSWFGDLEALSNALGAAVEIYPITPFGPEQVKRMLAPDNVIEALDHINTQVKAKYPESTPEQNAWDTLTRLEENLKAFETAQTSFENAKLSQTRATILYHSFVSARDSVLRKLYNDVSDRFVGLYRQLHGLDEGKFEAKIEPEEAALNFEVDFYGRGTHPPHALHSEGHQDSMGFCLYLALAERLTGGLIDLVILDDVVMSVDAGHRREVCRLLASAFPNRQFLITTHDRTWANQLKSEGIVDKQRTLEFFNWHIETGPCVCDQVDMWERIEEDLQKSDVPSAAGRLRRGSEQFFAEVCDALGARVEYKLNSQWELGDFLPAAMERYRDLLKLAKNAANSWGDNDCFEMLQECDSARAQVYARSSAEQWAVNVNVHYNNWASFSANDFRPVAEAFQDLYQLFLCSKCGGMLRLATSGKTPMTVRCNCGQVDWNLTNKGKID